MPQDLDHEGSAPRLIPWNPPADRTDELAEELADISEEMKSLERLYARALDAQVTAEKARDYARDECQRLLGENRALKARFPREHCKGSGKIPSIPKSAGFDGCYKCYKCGGSGYTSR